ncbi:MAG TPA: hypothetical protein VND15_01200 [Candidatus Acidoferrales bacterium]|nr:hypothetical protein [Candidatus Acidoferrales bacterium]
MDVDNKKGYLKGTTTIGLICSDGVVVGADSRATAYTFIANTEVRKVWKIDNNLAMTIAGTVGDAQELIRVLKAQAEIYKMNENRLMTPKSAASLLSIILQQNKYMPFEVGLIIAGLDGDVPQMYNIDAIGGYTEESKFTATGSGSLTAIGYLEDAYKKGLSVKEGVKIVGKALSIAMRRDAATGNNMTIAVITKNAYTEYTDKDLEKFSTAK